MCERLVRSSGARYTQPTDREQSDLELYDAIMDNDSMKVRLILAQTKRSLTDSFLVVRHMRHYLTSPINLAVSCGHDLMVKFFLETGVQVNSQNVRLKRAPLHVAALHKSIRCVQVLLAAHAKLDIRDVFGNSPCHYAAELGCKEILDIMIRMGAQVNCQDITGKTPLMKAVRNKEFPTACRIIRANADLNLADSNNEVALHFAVRSGFLPIINELLVSSCATDVQNEWGRTPLMEAVCNNFDEITQRLLQTGCDVNRKESKEGETALQMAVRKRYPQVLEVMLNYVLQSSSLTLYVLQTYDWDFREFTRVLEGEPSERVQEVTLFQLAAQIREIRTCQLLADLGLLDPSVRRELQNIAEDHLETENNVQAVITLIHAMRFASSLKHICRKVVRQQLRTQLSDKVPTLPVPLTIKDYLLLKNEFDEATMKYG